MARHWGSLEEIEAHVFEEYGRTMFEFQRLEFALERLAAQTGSGPKRPETTDATEWVEWIEHIRYKPPKKKLELVEVDPQLTSEVTTLLERRDEFAHERLLAGRDESPRFDPALARELIAEMRSLATGARELRERFDRGWARRVREQPGTRPPESRDPS